MTEKIKNIGIYSPPMNVQLMDIGKPLKSDNTLLNQKILLKDMNLYSILMGVSSIGENTNKKYLFIFKKRKPLVKKS